MKRTACIFIFVLLMCIFSFSVFAEEKEEKYTVKNIHGEYILLSGENEIKRENSILPILEELSGDVFFDNVRIFESVELTDKNACFSGSIFCDGYASLTIGNGSDIILSGLSLDFMTEDGYIKISGGALTADNSKITAIGKSAVYLHEGCLKILNDSIISAKQYDIISEKEIFFFDEASIYTGSEIFDVLYMGEGRNLNEIVRFKENPPIRIYAEDKEIQIYKITYINRHEGVFYEHKLFGEDIILPEGKSVLGYEFCGWISEGSVSPPPDTADSALTIYADYRLLSPTFSVNDITFNYDGRFHIISPENIMHPYLKDAALSFKWYKGTELVGKDRNLSLKDVTSSGKYTLEIELEYGNDTSVGRVCDINVNIIPATLVLEYKNGSFEISAGYVIDGEAPEIITTQKDDKIIAETNDNNYCLDFSPVILENKKPELQILGLAFVLLAIIIAVGYFVFFSLEGDIRIASINRTEIPEYSSDPFVMERYSSEEICDELFALDKIKADALLSDRMAKNLLKRGGTVEASGSTTETVSLGDICKNFDDNDIVNINLLKRCALVSEDCFKVKVTADGEINRPLKIMANDFDISAVKMITLSGGEAIKIKSRKTPKAT